MKLSDAITLNEAPLPDEWDKDMYNERVPFAQRVRYAQERAEKIGTGSSRVAFMIPYKGRPTILKISKNRKGAYQNEVEAEVMSDGFHGRSGVTIPLIDYDERNSMPTWIHTERADKIRSQSQLETLLSQFYAGITGDGKVKLYALEQYLKEMKGQRPNFSLSSQDERDAVSENVFIQRLLALVMDYDLAVGDILRPANWGVYRNQPVLIDIGANETVISNHYSR